MFIDTLKSLLSYTRAIEEVYAVLIVNVCIIDMVANRMFSNLLDTVPRVTYGRYINVAKMMTK